MLTETWRTLLRNLVCKVRKKAAKLGLKTFAYCSTCYLFYVLQVNRAVARNYVSSTNDKESDKKVQAPFFYSTLTAKVFFIQKINI
jgi:hypothetical protein